MKTIKTLGVYFNQRTAPQPGDKIKGYNGRELIVIEDDITCHIEGCVLDVDEGRIIHISDVLFPITVAS